MRSYKSCVFLLIKLFILALGIGYLSLSYWVHVVVGIGLYGIVFLFSQLFFKLLHLAADSFRLYGIGYLLGVYLIAAGLLHKSRISACSLHRRVPYIISIYLLLFRLCRCFGLGAFSAEQTHKISPFLLA